MNMLSMTLNQRKKEKGRRILSGYEENVIHILFILSDSFGLGL